MQSFICICSWMYWSDWGDIPKIEHASMDGQARQILHNTQLVRPNGLTLDYQNQVLYWIDASLDRIESSNVDGTNRTLIANFSPNYHPFSMSFFNNILYWTDWGTDKIHSIFANGTSLTSLIRRFRLATGIEVVSGSRQQLPPGWFIRANKIYCVSCKMQFSLLLVLQLMLIHQILIVVCRSKSLC